MFGQFNLLILMGQLIFLGVTTLLLHRLSPRFGLIPLLILLGGMVAALQYRILGIYPVIFFGNEVSLSIGSYVLLPTILLGLLIIYIVDGSIQARYTLLGIAAISLFIALNQSLLTLLSRFPPQLFSIESHTNVSPRIPIASAVTISVDMIVLVIIYQWVSNWREKHPSRFAFGTALFGALWCDAIVFPILAYLGQEDMFSQLPLNLLGKSLAAIVLWLLAADYIRRYARKFPYSSAATQRPPLEIFSTQLQLEQRARLHSNLLRTTNRINQLVVRSTDPNLLFQQTCELLTEHLDYELAWIGLCDRDADTVSRIIAKAGPKVKFLDDIRRLPMDSRSGPDPTGVAIRTKKAVIHRIDSQNPVRLEWYRSILEHRLSSFAAFPMRISQRVLGILGVYSQQSQAFDEDEELSLLQQLADDLAYAMVSLEARSQQAFLHASTETMRDGLLITDANGGIIYANPAIAEMLKYDLQDILGRSIYSFMTEVQVSHTVNNLLPTLEETGQMTIEIEIQDRNNQTFFAELTIAGVRNSHDRPLNFVVNVRDTTRRKLFEHGLLSLNRFSTELVQIRDPDELFNMILLACEELFLADASAIQFGNNADEKPIEVHSHNISDTLHLDTIEGFSRLAAKDSFTDWELVCCEDIGCETLELDLKERFNDLGVRSLMLLPISYQDVSIGILGLYFHSSRIFDESMHQLGLTATHTLAIALQNARLYQSEHSQRQFAEAIVQATEALNSSLDLDLVLSQILEQTYRVVPCNSVNLMLVEEDHAVVVRQLYLTPEGEIESVLGGPTLPLTTPTLFRMLNTGQPILITDTILEPEWKTLERSAWIRSYASAPLQIRQEVIGFLNVNSQEPHFFNDESLRRLQAFASHAAAALHNASLYGDLQKYSLQLEDRVDERTAQLSQAKERIEAILESVPDAVFVLDSEENLLESNQAGTLLLMQSDDPKTALFTSELMDQLKAGQAPDENAIVEVSGRIYQALSSPLPLPDQQAGLVIVFRDVTRFQELDRMKTQFVSDVSHELRTPLANLSLFLDLLADEEDQLRREKYQATLRRETNRLTELIEDLLTISRLESNRITFFIKEVQVVPLIRELVEDRSFMATQRDLELIFEDQSDLPNALVDQRLLNQVLSNILTNAMNYTPAGGQIHLVASQDRTDSKPWVTISVKDNGYGILPEELPVIFERFYRGSASRKTGAPGTGLGLAISQEIIERMGGRIDVESEIGKGSTFTVWVRSVL